MGTALLAGAVAWLAITVLAQASPWVRRRVDRVDRLGLVPNWHMFSDPPTETFLLAVRSLPGNWIVVPDLQRRSLLHGLWNPELRYGKLLYDTIYALLGEPNLVEGRVRPAGKVSYLLLAKVALGHLRSVSPVPVERFQFAILAKPCTTDDPHRLVFRSRPVLASSVPASVAGVAR